MNSIPKADATTAASIDGGTLVINGVRAGSYDDDGYWSPAVGGITEAEADKWVLELVRRQRAQSRQLDPRQCTLDQQLTTLLAGWGG